MTLPARLRYIRRLTLLVLTLAFCLPPHLVYRLFVPRPRGPRSPVAPWFLGLAGRALGVRVTIVGTPLRRHALILANHMSWLDILAMGGASGTAFVAKDDIAAWPVVGWLAEQNNTIFIARSKRGAVGDQLAALRVALQRDQPVTIFPEGTTGDGTSLLPFKSALLAVLDGPPQALMVQPTALDYGAASGEVHWPASESAMENFRRLVSRKGPLDLTIRFLDPFDPDALANRKEIAARAQADIDAALRPSAGDQAGL